MIYLDKLNTKLGAILGKDVDEIIAEGIYIPTLGNNYNKNALQNWLQKRIDVLVELRDGNYTDQQIQNYIDFHYSRLSAEDKLIADLILAGEPYMITDDNQMENLTLFVLVRSLTTP